MSQAHEPARDLFMTVLLEENERLRAELQRARQRAYRQRKRAEHWRRKWQADQRLRDDLSKLRLRVTALRSMVG